MVCLSFTFEYTHRSTSFHLSFTLKRAFADAHRALVASLEWDMGSEGDLNDGSNYPLLQCLLQNEDMFFELEDHQCRN